MRYEPLALPDGREVGVFSCGDPAGEPLLFFHGWPGSAPQAALAHQVGRSYGWNIRALDRPGIGLSTREPGRTIEDWTTTVGTVLDMFCWADCHLLAISGGAPYAHACIQRMPHRFSRATLCCAAPPLAELDHQRDLFPLFRLALAIQNTTPGLTPALLRLVRGYLNLSERTLLIRPWLGLLPQPDRAAILHPANWRNLSASSRHAFRQGPRGVLDDGDALRKRWNFNWRDAPLPIHFHHGDLDRTIPLRMARQTVAAMRGPVHLTVYPGEGHFSLPITRAEQLLNRSGA